MLTITSFYSNFYYNCIDHFFQKNSISKERTLFFDIETTGLSHKTSHIYLIGAAVLKKLRSNFINFWLNMKLPKKRQHFYSPFISSVLTVTA